MRPRRALITALVGLTVLAGGCSTGTSAAPSPSASSTPGKFDQTYTKAIGDTTCGDWHSALNKHERFVMAADMLVSSQSVDGGKKVLPEDSLINDFTADISTACEADANQGISGIAAAVYMTGRTTYGP